MSGFNTSTRRPEDTSTKLKAQNLRNAKDQSRRLEEENIRMEDRLRELKLAMRREKEERERKGGGFWAKGQTGTLNNYAAEVLEKSKSIKKEKGIKILKDEPIILPERSSQPGTMKYIAQRSLDGKENKPKFLKCGQCEDKSAVISCQQCSEYYCTRCFAAFHIKGALKKHRSIPISATGPRHSMSPRTLNSYRSLQNVSPQHTGSVYSSRSYDSPRRNGPEGASGSFDGPSLMSGHQYNEAESAASFQQALVAWRSGDNKQSPRRRVLGTKKPSPRTIVVSPVKSPVFSIESSTSTTVIPVSPDIHFHSNITYAERLLLKNHRRTDVPSLQPSVTSTNGQTSFNREGSRYDDSDEDPVSFKALYEASVISDQSSQQDLTTESNISIIDLEGSQTKQIPISMEYSDKYQVQEVGPYESWEVENLKKALAAVVTPRAAFTDGKPPLNLRAQPSKSATSSKRDVTLTSFMSQSDVAALDADNRHKRYMANSNRGNQHSGLSGGDEEMDFIDTNELEPELQFSETSLPKSRPVSVKSRASVRAKSAKSRAASKRSSRAPSRAKSVVGEGLLTKVPSESLREIASRLGQNETYSYKSPMQEFFTMGVKAEFQERSITPSSKKTKEQSLKISNKFYQMAPRSWKPESSLEDTLASDHVYMEDSEVLQGYMLDDQMDGQAAGDCCISSRNEKTPTNESPVWQVPSVSRQNTQHSQSFASKTPQPFRENTQHSLTFANKIPQISRENTQHSQTFASKTPQLSRENSYTQNSQSFANKTPQPFRENTQHSQSFANKTPQLSRENTQNSQSFANKTPQLSRENTKNSQSFANKSPQLSRENTQNSQTFASKTPAASREDPLHSKTLSRMTPEPKMTPRKSSNRPISRQESRPASRAIVVDGEDMSKYDDTDVELQDDADNETLEQLEWELASQSGRLTADGHISKMSAPDEDLAGSGDSRSVTPAGLRRTDQSYDIGSKLRADELSDETDENDNVIVDTEDVKALH